MPITKAKKILNNNRTFSRKFLKVARLATLPLDTDYSDGGLFCVSFLYRVAYFVRLTAFETAK